MNTTETHEMFGTENILILTNVLTAGLALLSEIMAISKCKDNGLIDICIKSFKKTMIENLNEESNV